MTRAMPKHPLVVICSPKKETEINKVTMGVIEVIADTYPASLSFLSAYMKANPAINDIIECNTIQKNPLIVHLVGSMFHTGFVKKVYVLTTI